MYAAGFSLGSGIKGDGVIDNITVDDTEYRFTSDSVPCSENYFVDEDMWEITWGRQYDNTGDLPTFTMESFGGLVGYNDGPVPTYMTDYVGDPGWQWFYPTGADVENGRTVIYDFADGTRITGVLTADAEGCPFVTGRLAPPRSRRSPSFRRPTTPSRSAAGVRWFASAPRTRSPTRPSSARSSGSSTWTAAAC